MVSGVCVDGVRKARLDWSRVKSVQGKLEKIELRQVNFGHVELGQYKSGKVESRQDRSSYVSTGHPSQNRSSQVWKGQVK